MIKSFIQTKYFNSTKHLINHIQYIDRQSSVFGLEGELPVDEALEDAMLHSKSQFWRQIYSLNVKDCERLSIDREYMKNLLVDKKSDIATAYNISPEKLRIVASWHEKDHHPHVHIVFYSTNKREGHLHVPKGSEHKKILNRASVMVKQSLTIEIFKNDLLATKQLKHALRTDLNQRIEDDLSKFIKGKSGYTPPKGIRAGLAELGKNLSALSGKNKYGYLPPAIKKDVDTILQQIVNGDKTANKLFSNLADTQKTLIETYANREDTISSKMIKWQDEFYHPGKGDDTKRHNLIIAAAEKMHWLAAKPELRPTGTFVDKSPGNIASNLMWGICRSLKQSAQYNQSATKQHSKPPAQRNKKLKKIAHRQNRNDAIYEQ